jgi:hypothetical protein
MSDKSPSKNLIDKLPDGVKKNLSSGEKVKSYLKTFEVADKPNYIILTNLRVAYFDEKHLGRYVFQSIPFEKILHIRAHRGAAVWGEISLESEDHTVIQLKRVSRGDVEGFINDLEKAYNSIAVEPISIKHQKDLVGKATWEFDKPAETIVRQKSADQPKPS